MIQQRDDFDKFDITLRNFIAAFSRGQTHLTQLLSKESESIKEHINAETSKSRNVITSRIISESSKTRQEFSTKLDNTAADAASMAQHERILRSLKYDDMNERRNSILPSHPETFEWIFDDKPVPVSNTDMDSLPIGTDQDSQSEIDSEIPYVEEHSPSHQGNPWDSFTDWLQSTRERLYWISGKAGSGKSTLMKFLIQHQQTQSGLESWNPNTLILSHFLWTAGQPMGKKIKGIFCSILYQLLCGDSKLSDSMILHFPRIRSKNFHSDWSDEELETVVFYAFGVLSRAICIFLDGLDEICPTDGLFRLLEVVDKFRVLPRLKICVSSRLEPLLQRHLGNFPKLRLQDLTRRDIWRYSAEFLRPHFRTSDKEFSDFIQEVCRKADGVFLWVSLALKSLRNGLSNRDDMKELRQRLDALPSDLYQLYQDMWNRLNDSQKIYREDAATYFNLVLDSSLIGWLFGFTVTVFHLMAVNNPSVAQTVLKDCTALSPKELEKECQKTSEHLETRCAGLLEVAPSKDTITFIHRSAKEFLKGTAEGQQILKYDRTTVEERIFNLLKAELTLLRLQSYPSSHLHTDWKRVTSTCNFVAEIHHLLDYRRLSAPKALELMHSCEEFYKTGEWHYNSGPKYYPLRPDFNAIAAAEGVVEFVSSAVKSLRVNALGGALSESYKSYLLSAACSRHYIAYDVTKNAKTPIIAWLLEEGINSNIRSIDITHIPAEEYLLSRTPIMTLLSIGIASRPCDIPALPGFVKQLLERGACLRDRTILVLHVSDQPDYFWMCMNWNVTSDSYDDLGMIIFEVDLSFLIKIYLKTTTRSTKALPAAQDLHADIGEGSVLGSVAILAFSFSKSFSPAADDGGRKKFYIPATENDADYALRTLDEISDPSFQGDYEVPGLWDRLREIAGRARETTFEDVEADLVKRGHLVRVEDLKDWPPNPFAP